MSTRSPLFVAALATLLTACAPLGEPILYDPGAPDPALPPIAEYQALAPEAWDGIPHVAHRPVSGGTLALSPDESTLVAAVPDYDAVHVIDRREEVVRAVFTAPGDPGRVVIASDGARAYVALRGAGAVLVIDLWQLAVRALIDTCPSPRGLALEHGGRRLHVACLGGALETYDTDDGRRLRRVPVAPDLRDVVVTGDAVMVSRFRAAELIVLDDDGRIVRRSRPQAFDGRTPAVAWRTVAGPDGAVYMLHQLARTRVRAAERNHAFDDPPPFFGDYRREDEWGRRRDGVDPCRQPVLSTVTRFAGDGTAQGSISVTGVDLAVDLGVNPTPSRRGAVFLALASAVDNTGDIGADSGGFLPPWPGWEGWLCTPKHDELEHQGPLTSVVIDRRGSWSTLSQDIRRVRFARRGLPGAAPPFVPAAAGRWTMQAPTLSGLTCTTCHPEGAEDGLVWHFGDAGPARTQDLRGGIGDSAPFHWRQDMADMRAIVDDMMVGRMGLEWPVTPDWRQDIAFGLTAWFDTLDAPVVDPIEPGDTDRGAVLFERAGCADCHSGPRHSDGLLHDVGTGEALETPTLVGVGRRARLMHDGCADDLRGRFDPDCGGRRHGDVDGLSAADLDDLIAYLATL